MNKVLNSLPNKWWWTVACPMDMFKGQVEAYGPFQNGKPHFQKAKYEVFIANGAIIFTPGYASGFGYADSIDVAVEEAMNALNKKLEEQKKDSSKPNKGTSRGK